NHSIARSLVYSIPPSSRCYGLLYTRSDSGVSQPRLHQINQHFGPKVSFGAAPLCTSHGHSRARLVLARQTPQISLKPPTQLGLHYRVGLGILTNPCPTTVVSSVDAARTSDRGSDAHRIQ